MNRERKHPGFFSSQRINTVRLFHLKRKHDGKDPCDTCGAPIKARTHWRVRALLGTKETSEESIHEDAPEIVTAYACREACAREIFESLRVEIALITGKKPEKLR